ncbi:hypothetical protein [Devosia sp.]|uniref:hypothetical protein n=1 Tax=Devosia sp. TaxID=1871048 RepID=UPI0032631ACF
MFNLITRFHLLLLTVLTAMTIVAFVRVPVGFAYPAHWGPHSEADWLWPRDVALLGAPVVAVGFTLAFAILGLLLGKSRLLQSRHVYEPILTVILTVIASVQMGLLLTGVGSDLDLVRMTGYGLGALLVVTGIVFAEAERHSYAGLRLPWPVEGDRAWRAVHLSTGIACGLAGAGLAFAAWLNVDLSIAIASLATALITPMLVAGVATLTAKAARR